MAASVLFLVACGADPTGGPDPDAGVDVGSDADADATPDDAGIVDTGEDIVDTSIVGTPCSDASECEGGLCLELGGASGQCSILCESSSGCPDEWSCVSIAGPVGTLQVCAPSGLCIDEDGDGFGIGDMCDGADCDDTNPDANPIATEVCDGIDNDCDGGIDDSAIDVNTACELDEGTCSTGRTVCTSDGNLVCNPTTNPVTEICDELDNDCDGIIDEDAADGLFWHVDADGDGFGDKDDDAIYSCSPIDGRVANPLDCDDTDMAINPAATETDCDDPRDYNCDGAAGSEDGDGDGYGACEECDDSDAMNSPVGIEVCDGGDNDCDGIADEGQSSMASCATGEPGVCDVGVQLCVGGNSLCVRANEPDAELCDGLDNDCDGIVDENVIDGLRFYRDADGDGSGAASDFMMGCAPDDGYVTNANDCDDTDPATYLNASEICDGADNSCDDLVDEGSIAGIGGACTTDQVGECSPGISACGGVDGIICAPRTPATDEVCNGRDDDCDGTIDNGVSNDCGGCSDLPATVGANCNICSAGTWACAGPDSLVCRGDTCSFVDVAGSGTQICGLYPGGSIACSGELGERNVDGQNHTDVAMSDRRNFACATTNSGVVECWGPDSSDAIVPTEPGQEEIQIATHLCARNQSGITCNDSQLLGAFTSMDVWRELVCGLTDDDGIICMGGASEANPTFGGCPGYNLTEPGALTGSSEVAAWSDGTAGMVCGVQNGRIACEGCDAGELQDYLPRDGALDIEFGDASICSLSDQFEVSCHNAGLAGDVISNVSLLDRATNDGYIGLSRTGEVIRPWGRGIDGDRWDIRLPVQPDRVSTEFGTAVAIYLNTVAVGAPTGGLGGEVTFYGFDGSTWKRHTGFNDEDGQDGDRFGAAVALWEDIAVVGAPGSDRFGTNVGAVFVYRNDEGGNWTLLDVIAPPTDIEGMAFGSSLAIQDTRLVIGAPHFDSDIDANVGAVFAYRFDVDRFEHIWSTTGTRRNEEMGYAVDINRDTIAVGAPGYDEFEPDGGAVDLYAFTARELEFITRLTSKHDEPGDRLGSSVAVDGSNLFVGVPALNTGRPGRVINYNDLNTTWQEGVTVVASTAGPNDEFGRDVALARGVLLATTSSDTYAFSGAEWPEVYHLVGTGFSIDAFGRQAIVGELREDRVSTLLLPFLVPQP